MAIFTYPTFLYEFRSLKLESMIKDLHKMTPDELKKIKREIDSLLVDVSEESKVHA